MRTSAGGRSDVRAGVRPSRAVQCAALADWVQPPIVSERQLTPDMRKMERSRRRRIHLGSFGRSGMQSVAVSAGQRPEADTRVSAGAHFGLICRAIWKVKTRIRYAYSPCPTRYQSIADVDERRQVQGVQVDRIDLQFGREASDHRRSSDAPRSVDGAQRGKRVGESLRRGGVPLASGRMFPGRTPIRESPDEDAPPASVTLPAPIFGKRQTTYSVGVKPLREE